jgi:hypothetical protein
MNRLIRFALAFSPREFRRNFQSDVSYDAEHGSRPVVLEALDIIASGIALHLEGAWRNLSLGARALNRSRLYAFVSVLTIALAIGANITVASTIQGVLLDPLPYPNASNLYYASKHGPYGGWSYLNAHDYLARSTTVADLGIAGPDTNTLLGRGASVRLDGRQVDGGYFRVLGAHALIGRLITAADMTRRVVVLSNDVWRANFGADPGIVGRRIDLGQTFYLVIGVMAPTFRDPGYGSLSRAAFWIPDDRFARSVRVRGDSEAFVRLRPGVSVGAAQADLRRVITQLDREYPNPAQQNGVPPELVALIDRVVGDVRPLLWLLYGAVAVLLLVALANIANLALVRAAARESELAVRSAPDAARSRDSSPPRVRLSLWPVASRALRVRSSRSNRLRCSATIFCRAGKACISEPQPRFMPGASLSRRRLSAVCCRCYGYEARPCRARVVVPVHSGRCSWAPRLRLRWRS